MAQTAQRSKAMETLSDLRYKVLPIIEWPLDRFSQVGAGEFYDLDLFPWIPRIEEGYESIRAELDAVLAKREEIPTFQEVLPSQELLTSDQKWRTYMFYGYGHRHDANCAECPETAKLVESIPGMKTAFFSILAPGKVIPPHRGFYKGVLRYHLGLKVPSQAEKCRIRVGDTWQHWEEGRSMVFDDTYEHEVENDTEEERVVLFVDMVRPLPFPLSTANHGMIKLISMLPEIRRASKEIKQP